MSRMPGSDVGNIDFELQAQEGPLELQEVLILSLKFFYFQNHW